MLSPEELMKPRYRVSEEGYPDMPYKSGQIITLSKNEDERFPYFKSPAGELYYPAFFDTYPSTFKEMQWWQERKPEDMPQYVKWVRTEKEGTVQRADFSEREMGTIILDNCSLTFSMWIVALIPSTEEEYLNYINSQS